MAGRINETVFWPRIDPDITKTRGACMTCVREAPSKPAGTRKDEAVRLNGAITYDGHTLKTRTY